MDLKDSKMVVVGLGLMGTGFALAVRSRQLCRVEGVDTDPGAVDEALRVGAISDGGTDLTRGIDTADIIVLAAPVRAILAGLGVIAETVERPCVVFDVGSTKQVIVESMAQLPPHVDAVGGHPMCGGPVSADQYVDRVFVLCPVPGKSDRAQATARHLVQGIGAQPMVMQAADHDRLAATISHYQYLLSILSIQVASIIAEENDLVWELAAGSFDVMTALSNLNLPLWTDTLLTNNANLQHLLSLTQAEIGKWQAMLEARSEAEVTQALKKARDLRVAFEHRRGEQIAMPGLRAVADS